MISNIGFVLEHFGQTLPPTWPGGFWWHWVVFTVIIIAFVLTMVMGYIWLERRGMGRMQARLGPNRAGPLGLLQPVADAIKVLIKEDIVPTKADKTIHWLAPIVAFSPVLMIFAVVPFHGAAVNARHTQILKSNALGIKHAKNIMVGNDQQLRRRAESIIRIAEQPRVHMPVWADQRQVSDRLIQFEGHFSLPGIGIKITIFREVVR